MSEIPNPVMQTFWATSFFALMWPEHERWREAIKQYVYALRDEQSSNIASGIATGAKSPAGIYESDFDLLERDHVGLQALRSFIVGAVASAVAKINGDQRPATELVVEICDSWFHITNDGGFHDTHYHGNCSWCGIYYLQLGEAGQRRASGAPNGGNRFYSPLWHGGQFNDYGNQYLGATYIDPPIRDGMLLLFPSYLMHSGLPYQGAEDRIVISFNTSTTIRQPLGSSSLS